ncbi:MAG: tetraacyldisaccharide 4'-kinase [Flavobacteriales bacterium]|jgi:tetraacyldisaccharide 4'-kinase
MSPLSIILYPFSMLYAAILWLRHGLYNRGILKSQKGVIPTIVVGNLNLGGTGKTPHALMFSNFIKKNFEMALLSRGYGRKSKGFFKVDENGKPEIFGDEPLLLQSNLPDVPVFVCENRVEGIHQIAQILPKTEIVLLDDAYQHRALNGDIQILLTDFHQPFFKDYLIPSGKLRDIKSRWKAADIIFVTKSPVELTENQRLEWLSKFPELSGKPIFFSYLVYGSPRGVYTDEWLSFKPNSVFGLSGLANNKPFMKHLETNFSLKKFKSYADHHHFSGQDVTTLRSEFGTFADPFDVVLMTEKDAVKWKNLQQAKDLPLYYVPIEIRVHEDKGKKWEEVLSDLLKKIKKKK